MPTPSTRPEVVISDKIHAAVSSLVVGTNMFLGPPKPWKIPTTAIPRNAVFVYSMLSFRPEQYIGTGEAFRDFRIYIFVRQAQDQFATGQALTRDIWVALNQANVTSSGYVGCLMAESDAQYLGMDDVDDHRWVLTARLLYKG